MSSREQCFISLKVLKENSSKLKLEVNMPFLISKDEVTSLFVISGKSWFGLLRMCFKVLASDLRILLFWVSYLTVIVIREMHSMKEI